MSYFPDLSPYAYGHHPHPGVVHVGWLDGTHEFAKGEISQALIEKMKRLAKNPTEIYRGFHVCEICEPSPAAHGVDDHAYWELTKPRRSNGEIRVSRGGVIFAAPIGIIHYIEAHRYLPPEEFLKAIEEAGEPGDTANAGAASSVKAILAARRRLI